MSRKFRIIAGALIGLLITPAAAMLALYSAGAGHGDYFFMLLFFPLPMLLTLFNGNNITMGLFAAGAIQFPIYGALLGWAWGSTRRIAAVAALYILPLLAAFSGLLQAFF